jgi:8-hydroxy-5-deazaflavin:NADPH oxidoreductase
MDELLVSRGTSQTGFWAVAIAGDVPAAKLLVAELVRDTGFIPVDIGVLAKSAPLDPGGILFPHMFTEADMRAALKLKRYEKGGRPDTLTVLRNKVSICQA